MRLKILVLMIIVMATIATTKAAVEFKCDPVLGESVYSTFNIEFKEMSSEYGLPYSLRDLEGTQIVLDGKANPNHPDIIEDLDDWSYVTLGKRTATIKDYEYSREGLGFSIETCKDCDFNSAVYQYRKSNESEVFITEDYGSDGSGEFSVYKCEQI